MQWRVVRRQRRLRRGERAGQQRRPRMARAKACPFKLTISPYSLEQEHTHTDIACKVAFGAECKSGRHRS